MLQEELVGDQWIEDQAVAEEIDGGGNPRGGDGTPEGVTCLCTCQ